MDSRNKKANAVKAKLEENQSLKMRNKVKAVMYSRIDRLEKNLELLRNRIEAMEQQRKNDLTLDNMATDIEDIKDRLKIVENWE